MTKPVEYLAQEVVDRVMAVYNPVYIENCLKNEPNSLLALVKELGDALEARRNGEGGC